MHASWSRPGARPADRPNSQLPLARNLRARMKTKMRHSFSSILKCPTQRSLQFSNCQVSRLKKSPSLVSTRRASNSTFTSMLLSGLDLRASAGWCSCRPWRRSTANPVLCSRRTRSSLKWETNRPTLAFWMASNSLNSTRSVQRLSWPLALPLLLASAHPSIPLMD